MKDEADFWWKENRISAIEGFNWDSFTTTLRGKFYPAFIRKPYESNYPTHDLEFAAIIFALKITKTLYVWRDLLDLY